MKMRSFFLFLFILSLQQFSFSQVTTDTIYLDTDGFDSYVYSGSTGTNYGTDTSAKVSWEYGGTSYANRMFLQADLSSIPRYVYVTDAELHLYAEAVDNSADHPIHVMGVLANWTEGGITWSNQPTVTSVNRASNTHAATSSTGWHVTNIKNLAQVAVTLPEKNYGWRVTLQSESGTVSNGITYATTNDPDTGHRPYIIVKYVNPIEINGYVSHCTNGNSDGAITVNVTGGSSSYTYYKWQKLAAGALTFVEQGTNIADAGISNLADGLYHLEVTDNLGVKGYRFFFVGEEGTTTDVSFSMTGGVPRAAYTDDALVVYNKSTKDSSTLGATSSTVGCYTSTTYNMCTDIRYQVDWDPSLEYTLADQAFTYKGGCYQNTISDNDAWISRITSDWDERYVTWGIRPTVTTENRVYIPTTTTNGIENRNDTVDILPLIPHWQSNPDENFGFELSLNAYDQASTAYRDYNSSDQGAINLMVSFTVKPKIETTYIDTLGKGHITVNAPAAELPYTYLIGLNEIPALADIWSDIKDSIDIDSTVFFRGKSNTRNYTFENLPAEHYYVAVFDNNGNKIFDQEVLLTAPVSFVEVDGLQTSDGTISVDPISSSGEASIDRVLLKNQSAAFEFQITQIGDLIVGFNNLNDTLATDSSDFEFGINFNNTTKHYQVFLSDSILYEDTVIADDQFRLAKENYDLIVMRNGWEVHREKLVPADDLKIDVVFKAAVGIMANAVLIGKLPKTRPLQTTVYNTECDAGNGSIRISFAAAYLYSGTTLAEYEVIDPSTSSVVASGTLSYPSYTTVPLPVGSYIVHLHWTNGTIDMDWYEYFDIGQPIEWLLTNLNFMSVSGTVNTIKTITNGTIGTALSQNTLKENVEGWVTFNVGFSYKPPLAGTAPTSPILYANVSMVDEIGLQKIRVRVVGMGAFGLSKYVFVYDANDDLVGSPLFIGASDGPIKISLEAGYFDVYYNNGLVSIATVSEGTPGDYKVDANAYSGNIHDSYASFCYGLTSTQICGHLDYELDGNYYVTNSGKFCFVYNEEYNDPTIQLNIYDNNQNLVATQADFLTNDLIYGENRVILDFTSNGHCLPIGFYILEVINDKGEKFYLRFYNRYTCTPAWSYDENGNAN